MDDTLRRLEQWGEWSRTAGESLGLPASSSIALMIERTKVFAQPGRNSRMTAICRQTRVMTAPRTKDLPDEVFAVDRIVAQAPAMYQKPLKRRYIFRQPDRFAARELRMERAVYTQIAEDAVRYVENKLERLDSV